MSYRFTYQLIRDGLDDKIGRDLRRVVESYLGADPGKQRFLHTTLCVEIIWFRSPSALDRLGSIFATGAD
jgi:hypothetical protein